MIGILAGMGPKSTGPFIDQVVSAFQSLTGAKNDIDFPSMLIYSLPTPFYVDRPIDHKLIPQKIELNRVRLPGPIVILAINNARLGSMKLQTALPESIPDGFQHRTSLLLTPAVDDGIVRITLELDVRKSPLHPDIERVMQEEIG